MSMVSEPALTARWRTGAVKTAQNGICVIGVAGILDNLCSCKRHVIRDGQNCVYAVRVLLDNCLHSGCCLVRHGVGVLHFEHLTACGFDRISVAAQACFMGLVACTPAMITAVGLSLPSACRPQQPPCRRSALRPRCRCQRSKLLVRGEVSIQCKHRLVRGSDKGSG